MRQLHAFKTSDQWCKLAPKPTTLKDIHDQRIRTPLAKLIKVHTGVFIEGIEKYKVPFVYFINQNTFLMI
jgi:hypothetical protein